ncbi:hypothetical protein Tco_1193331 [Tanacetum coccineum]
MDGLKKSLGCANEAQIYEHSSGTKDLTWLQSHAWCDCLAKIQKAGLIHGLGAPVEVAEASHCRSIPSFHFPHYPNQVKRTA